MILHAHMDEYADAPTSNSYAIVHVANLETLWERGLSLVQWFPKSRQGTTTPFAHSAKVRARCIKRASIDTTPCKP